MLYPASDYVAFIAIPKKAKSDIVIAGDNKDPMSETLKVIAVGPKVTMFAVGDNIVATPHGVRPFLYNGRNCLAIKEAEIIGKVEGENTEELAQYDAELAAFSAPMTAKQEKRSAIESIKNDIIS